MRSFFALLLLVGCKDTVQHGVDPDADAPTSTSLVQVAAGWEHVCVRAADGAVGCMGNVSSPNAKYANIAAGRDVGCGLDNQIAECWPLVPANPPTDPLSSITIAEDMPCGLAMDNTLRCWGGAPAAPSGTFKQVDGGWRFFCAIRSDDTVTCWGDTGTVGVSPPTTTFASISAAHEHVCGLHFDKTLECWGDNSEDQMPPSGLQDPFEQVAAGENLTCALRSDQRVVCWGVGFSATRPGPTGKFVAIDANTDFACGIRPDGTAICWNDTTEYTVTL